MRVRRPQLSILKMTNSEYEYSKAPLPMQKRIALAKPGKLALDKTRRIDRFKKPHVRQTIQLGKLSNFLSMPLDIVLEVSQMTSAGVLSIAHWVCLGRVVPPAS